VAVSRLRNRKSERVRSDEIANVMSSIIAYRADWLRGGIESTTVGAASEVELWEVSHKPRDMSQQQRAGGLRREGKAAEAR
jgi:hypothetical protein